MHGLTCDRCDGTLLLDSEVRYTVKIEITAAYDPLEITAQDLERDQGSAMAELIDSMKGMDPEELEAQVYKRFDFDLCPRCQKSYLANCLLYTSPSPRDPE